MKVAVYNRHLPTLGGGEKFSLSVAEVLGKNRQVDYLSYQVSPKDVIEERLNVDLSQVKMRTIPDISNEHTADKITRDYDLFINASYMTSLPSRARKSMLIVYFPTSLTKDLSSLQKLAIRVGSPILKKIDKTSLGLNIPSRATNLPRNLEFLDTYNMIVANSLFAQRWIKKMWSRESELLYPPVDLGDPGALNAKSNIILSVGRFFAEEHSKKQLELIQAFKMLLDEGLKGWEYHLAGGLGDDPKDRRYFNQAKEAATGYPVTIHPNISRVELDDLYRRSKIFWHAAGYGEDERQDPETFEHFGIATVEAMSWGCVPMVFRGGGAVEIVEQGENGFLWSTHAQLKKMTHDLIVDVARREQTSRAACKRSEMFSKANFSDRLTELIAKVG